MANDALQPARVDLMLIMLTLSVHPPLSLRPTLPSPNTPQVTQTSTLSEMPACQCHTASHDPLFSADCALVFL